MKLVTEKVLVKRSRESSGVPEAQTAVDHSARDAEGHGFESQGKSGSG